MPPMWHYIKSAHVPLSHSAFTTAPWGTYGYWQSDRPRNVTQSTPFSEGSVIKHQSKNSNPGLFVHRSSMFFLYPWILLLIEM